MQGEGRKLVRNVKWLGVGLGIFLAVVSPFSKTVYGVPWAILGLLVWVPLAYAMLAWARRTAPYREAAPTKEAPLVKSRGQWFALVYWPLPMREWRWRRARDAHVLGGAIGMGGTFVVMWAAITVVGGFDPFVAFLFFGVAAVMGAMAVLGAVVYDVVAVRVG